MNGVSGAGPITHFDASLFKTQFACEVKNFDAKKTGEQEITVIFTNADEKTKEETIKISVKDTKKPVIKLKKEKVEWESVTNQCAKGGNFYGKGHHCSAQEAC